MRHLLALLGWLLVLSACQIYENRVTEQEPSTVTANPFTTATPGGRISVFLSTPIGNEGGEDVAVTDTEGQQVGPAGTATAAAERIAAATATAQAPTQQPAFQPDDCPTLQSIPAPRQPATFLDYPVQIGVFLSNGGVPAVLESSLRTWDAISEQGGFIQANTDLTGDGIPEIIVNFFNPTLYNPEAVLNSGRLLIYGCDNGGYRLLYSTPDNPGLALPVVHRVGDMNADVKAEVVFDIQSCTTTYCNREGYILTWNPVVGVFESLNSGQIIATNGRLGVQDFEDDGILELTVASLPPGTASTGPTRGVVDVWDFNGTSYVLAVRFPNEAQYRVHVVHDADSELLAGNLQEATRLYQLARDAEEPYLSWSIANEFILLRAYANYRLVTTYVRRGNQRQAEDVLSTLLAENPAGTPGASFASLAEAFMNSVRTGGGSAAGCQTARTVLAETSDVLNFVNSYGTANRRYAIPDLCPF